MTPTATPTIASQLTALPARLNFGSVAATSSSKTEKLTLQNASPIEAQIGHLNPPAAFSTSSDHCSNKLLKPKQKCTVGVAFSPAEIHPLSEPFLIPYNGTSPSMVLEGTGVAVTLTAPSLKTLPSAAAGMISKAGSIIITNKSSVTVRLGAASAIPDFMITADTCANASVPARRHCVVMVKFTPASTSSVGVLNSKLSYDFTYGANSGVVSVMLDGTVK
jgi:hypothetical protein